MSVKLGGKKRFKSMKSAMRSLNKDTMPRTFDEVKDFLGRIDDEKYGLGVKPVTLADVMSYQDDPEMEEDVTGMENEGMDGPDPSKMARMSMPMRSN